MIERQAAIERGLAEQQHAARVAVAGGQFAEPGQRVGIAVLAHVAENRDRDLALVELVEQLHRADDFQPFGAAAAAGDAVQFDLRQSELGARQLAVIAGRLFGGAAIGGAGFLRAAGGFRRAALPVAGARQRGRIDAADADAREMLGGGRRIVEEAQRDPARGEFLLGLVDVAGGQRGVPRDQIGGAVFADVEHLARQQPPFDPPFVEIVQPGRILRRAQHQLRGLGEFLLAAQQLDLGEHVAGIAVQFARHRFEQRLALEAFWLTAMRALASAT